MRQPLRQNRGGAQTAIARPVPFPTDGWDTESPLASMPKTSAVILDNWIPRGNYGELRRGFIEQCTSTTDPVETLIAYRGDPTGDTLFAAAGAKLYDVTAPGSLSSAAYGSAVSAKWNYTNFANDAGRFALLFNGAQAPIHYDGSAFSALTITTVNPVGLTAANLKYVMAHKARVHMAEKDTLRVWFLDPNAIQGAAKLLDLGPIFTKGGSLVGLGRLTLDGGNGPDDYAVYLTSEGQVAIYQGTDPASASAWSLVGVFNLPRPIGDRCLLENGVDMLVLTEAGLLPLGVALRTPEEDLGNIALSKRINTAIADAASSYGALFGWQVVPYPGRGGLMIVNVPTAELSTSQQFVRSMQGKGAWCRFTGIAAFCWGYANGMIYFGSSIGVYRWDVGASDNSEPVVGDVLPAFQDFGNRTVTKVFGMVRALLRAPAIVKPALEIVTGYDKNTIPTDIQTVVTPADLSPEDSSLIRDDWTGAAGEGYVASPRMRVAVTGSDDVDRVAVTADHTELLLAVSPGTDHILSRPDLPLDVTVQCVGFDVMFTPGGQL